MNRIVLFLIVTSFTFALNAQEPAAGNTISIELGGSGISFSANFERSIYLTEKYKFQARFGMGYFPLYVNSQPVFGTINILAGVTYLQSLGSNHIEVGLTNCFSETFDESVTENAFAKTAYSLVPSVGYRYQNFEQRSLVLRAGYSPLLCLNGIGVEPKTVYYKNYFYLGIGYGF